MWITDNKIIADAAHWERAMVSLKITEEQRNIIAGTSKKDPEKWTQEEYELLHIVSGEARKIKRAEIHRNLPEFEHEKEHSRIWKIGSSYTGFLTAACIAIINSNHSGGSVDFAFTLWIIALPFLCGWIVLDYYVRVAQKRIYSKVNQKLLWIGFILSNVGTFGIICKYSIFGAVIFILSILIVLFLLDETIKLGGRKNFEEL